jgi:large subunit ribosomal protein L25
VSIAGLAAGSQVTAAEVKLPEGVELAADPSTVLVLVTAAPTEEEMAAEGVGEAAEAPAEQEAPVAAAEETATAEV